MWDDGQTGMMKAKDTFRNFANAPKNGEIYAHYNTNTEKSYILLNGYYPIDDRKHERPKRNVKTLLQNRMLCDQSYRTDLETTLLLLQELLPLDVVGAISCFE